MPLKNCIDGLQWYLYKTVYVYGLQCIPIHIKTANMVNSACLYKNCRYGLKCMPLYKLYIWFTVHASIKTVDMVNSACLYKKCIYGLQCMPL